MASPVTLLTRGAVGYHPRGFALNIHSHHDHQGPPLVKSGKMEWRSLSLFGRAVAALQVPYVRGAASALLLSTPLLFQKKLIKANYLVIIATTSMFLAVFDDLKSSTRSLITRLKVMQGSLRKHSSPLTREYFFKNENAADKVTILGVWVNILLSVMKFVGGLTFKSAVLVADAGHSLSDLFSDFITLWAVQVARLPPDDDHPYGHGKFESIGSLFLSLTLLLTGVGVASWSYEKMHLVLSAQRELAAAAEVTAPSWQASGLALLSIASKEWLFRVTKRVGDALNSQVVVANAWHHRSDAFSSVLSLLSIAIAILFPKYVVVDSACGIFIAGMIILTGVEILVESIKQLSDSSTDSSIVSNVKAVGESVAGVLGVQKIRARGVGNGNLVDLTILTDGKISTSAANVLAERVRWAVIEKMPEVLDVLVRTQSSPVVCPLLVRQQRTSEDIERSVREILSSESLILSRVNVHFLEAGGVGVEAFISSTAVSVDALKQAALRMKEVLTTQDKDILSADILLVL